MDDLKKDRDVIDAATPGPWDVWGDVADVDRGYPHLGDYRSIACCITGEDEYGKSVQIEGDMNNAEFIARARTRWPAALDEIERLRDELDALRNTDAAETTSCGAQDCPNLEHLPDGVRCRLDPERSCRGCTLDQYAENVTCLFCGRDADATYDAQKCVGGYICDECLSSKKCVVKCTACGKPHNDPRSSLCENCYQLDYKSDYGLLR